MPPHTSPCVSPWVPQAAYLAQSLTRLTDLVNMMLPAGTARAVLPGAEQGALVVERLREELGAVKGTCGSRCSSCTAPGRPCSCWRKGPSTQVSTLLPCLVCLKLGVALQRLAKKGEYQLSVEGPACWTGGSPARYAVVKDGPAAAG